MLNLAAVPQQINFFQRWNTMVSHSSLTSPPTNVPTSYRPRLTWLHLLQPGCCWLCSFWPHSHQHWNPPPLLHIVALQNITSVDSSLVASIMDSQISPRFPCWCCLTTIWPLFSSSLPVSFPFPFIHQICKTFNILSLCLCTCSASSWMCLNSSMSFSVRFSWPGSLSSSSRQSLPSWLSRGWNRVDINANLVRSLFDRVPRCLLIDFYKGVTATADRHWGIYTVFLKWTW